MTTLPSPPYSDGQTMDLDGVTYVYEAAKNRLKVKTNDVSSWTPASSSTPLTPDRTDFAATFDVNSPPGSPTIGQCVVIGSSPTGAFAGKTNYLAVYNGSWSYTAPYEGLIVWDLAANTLKAWDGSAWSAAVPATTYSVQNNSIGTAAIIDGAVTPAKINFKIVSKVLTVAPGGASIGDAYIVAATPSGGDAWFGQAGKLAIKIGAGNTPSDWAFSSLASGKVYWVADENALFGYSGSALVLIGPPQANTVPATALTDLHELVAAQARNIVAAIDADSGGGGALLTLRDALGLGSQSSINGATVPINCTIIINAFGVTNSTTITNARYLTTAQAAALPTPQPFGYFTPAMLTGYGGSGGEGAAVLGTFKPLGNALFVRTA